MTARHIDLTQFSLEELLILSSRIDLRIKELLSATAADSQAREDCPAPCGGCDHSSNPSSHTGTASPESVTLSERVRGLIQANDPLCWSQPFFGGSIIRDIVTVGLPEYMPRSSNMTLPTFGGPPCATFSVGKEPDASSGPSSGGNSGIANQANNSAP